MGKKNRHKPKPGKGGRLSKVPQSGIADGELVGPTMRCQFCSQMRWCKLHSFSTTHRRQIFIAGVIMVGSAALLIFNGVELIRRSSNFGIGSFQQVSEILFNRIHKDIRDFSSNHGEVRLN